MSKQADAKVAQGFRRKPGWPVCANCSNFKFDHVLEFNGLYNLYVDKNLRCGIGGFKVGKTDTCLKHTPMESKEVPE